MVVLSVSFSRCPPGNLSLCHQHEGDPVHGDTKTCLAILCAVPGHLSSYFSLVLGVKKDYIRDWLLFKT